MATQKNFDSVILPTIYQASGGGALTIPSSVGADTFVLLAASQTLTTKTLTSPTINGTIATTGLTLPAVTLGGTTTMSNGGIIQSDANGASDYWYMRGGDASAGSGAVIRLTAKAGANQFYVYTSNVAGDADVLRFGITGNLATAVATWANITQVGLVLGGNMTVTGYAFDAAGGSAQINTTALRAGLTLQSTQDGTMGAQLKFSHISASPAANDVMGEIYVNGKDSGGNDTQYISVQYIITSPTNGSETAEIGWQLINAGENNIAMTLSGAGGLAVDLDNGGTDYYVALFDEYDDAQLLKQGIQQNNRELLADIGVLERKESGSGYMMKIQPMVRLLAGGIYQTRQMLEDTIERLEGRLEQIESKQKLLGAG